MITQVAMTDLFLNDIETVTNRLTYEEQELATGNRVTSPAKDPAAAADSVEIGAAIDQNKVYQTNAQNAVSWLSETDASLESVSTYLSQAYQLAIQAANGTSTSQDLAAIAAQVQNIIDTVSQVEGQTFEGLPLFGGMDGATPGSANFTSSSNQPLSERIGSSLTIPVSVTDDTAFQATNVDGSLKQLETDLTSGNTANLSSDAQAIQNAQSALLTVVAGVGADQSLAQSAETTLTTESVTLETLQTETIGANAAQVAMQDQLDQNVYQDALAAAAKVIQPTLLNYLS